MSEEALSAWERAWTEVKQEGQNAFNDIANSYQDILIRGHLMPNRNLERDIAELEYGLDKDEYNQYLDQGRGDIPEPEPDDLEPER